MLTKAQLKTMIHHLFVVVLHFILERPKKYIMLFAQSQYHRDCGLTFCLLSGTGACQCFSCLYAAWAALEQCKLLSACGISFHLLFHQVEFCGQLLHIMLYCSQYLKHDYMAISDRTHCYLHQKLLLCYFILSYHLTLKIVYFISILFAFSLTLSCQNHLRKKRQLVSPYHLTSDPVFTYVNDQRGGHGTMKFSIAEFLSDFVEAHGQQVQSGETC